MMKIRKWWKQLRTKERFVVCALAAIATLWLGIGMSAIASAEGNSPPGKLATKVIKQTAVLKSSVTALATNTARHGWCISAVGPATVNSVPVWFTASTSASVTRAATATNGQLLGPGGPLSVCDDGAGGFVYTGTITVVALSTASGPTVTTTEW